MKKEIGCGLAAILSVAVLGLQGCAEERIKQEPIAAPSKATPKITISAEVEEEEETRPSELTSIEQRGEQNGAEDGAENGAPRRMPTNGAAARSPADATCATDKDCAIISDNINKHCLPCAEGTGQIPVNVTAARAAMAGFKDKCMPVVEALQKGQRPTRTEGDHCKPNSVRCDMASKQCVLFETKQERRVESNGAGGGGQQNGGGQGGFGGGGQPNGGGGGGAGGGAYGGGGGFGGGGPGGGAYGGGGGGLQTSAQPGYPNPQGYGAGRNYPGMNQGYDGRQQGPRSPWGNRGGRGGRNPRMSPFGAAHQGASLPWTPNSSSPGGSGFGGSANSYGSMWNPSAVQNQNPGADRLQWPGLGPARNSGASPFGGQGNYPGNSPWGGGQGNYQGNSAWGGQGNYQGNSPWGGQGNYQGNSAWGGQGNPGYGSQWPNSRANNVNYSPWAQGNQKANPMWGGGAQGNSLGNSPWGGQGNPGYGSMWNQNAGSRNSLPSQWNRPQGNSGFGPQWNHNFGASRQGYNQGYNSGLNSLGRANYGSQLNPSFESNLPSTPRLGR